jgi:hypothetical protein
MRQAAAEEAAHKPYENKEESVNEGKPRKTGVESVNGVKFY